MRHFIVRTIRQLFRVFGLDVQRMRRPHSAGPIPIGDLGLFWRDWIDRAPFTFANVYERNRQSQKAASEWMTEETLEGSLWRYGISSNEDLKILNQVDRDVTYTDVLSFLSTFLTHPRYLEIGVSAGKNFYQMSRQLSGALLVGIDIEEVNPALDRLLGNGRSVWVSEKPYPFTRYDGRTVETRFTLKEYSVSDNGNRVLYANGDKFTKQLWDSLVGMSFNLVFSDACHTPHSLETELGFMLQAELIDANEFIMVWDDIDSSLLPSAIRAMEKLSHRFPTMTPYSAVVEVHGTYGGNARGLHKIAVFVHDRMLSL